MSEHPSTQTSVVPSVSEFTFSPLRTRLRLELEATVAEVWELMGDLSRFPEYSAGLERVEVKRDEHGRCSEYTCYFRPVEEGAHGAVSRDVMRWYEPHRGYLSVEAEGDAGTEGAVAFMTLEPAPGGTVMNYEMYFDAEDLDAMKAALDEVNADMADRLIGRFGGRVVERYVEP
jgi:carbon monoxide dehydrogenase subunit G